MMYGSWFGDGYCPFFGGYGTFSVWHLLIMLGLFAVIIGTVFLFRRKTTSSQDLLDLLKVQFINGKITEEEYLNRKNVIERK